MPWFEKHWDMGDHQVQKLFATPPQKKKKRHLMKKPTIPTIPPTWGSQKPPNHLKFSCAQIGKVVGKKKKTNTHQNSLDQWFQN